MPTVQMLHTLRDLTGETECTVAGANVKQVLKSLERQYGEAFQEALPACKVTVNGLNVMSLKGVATRLSDDDVIALVPPMLGKQEA